jgi:hypothetical protein
MHTGRNLVAPLGICIKQSVKEKLSPVQVFEYLDLSIKGRTYTEGA